VNPGPARRIRERGTRSGLIVTDEGETSMEQTERDALLAVVRSTAGSVEGGTRRGTKKALDVAAGPRQVVDP